MKCDMICDLLPLYIDGLTSEESNREIEAHLRSCKKCRKYYQEMTGDISNAVPITEDEIQDVNFIKKMKKKNRRKIICAVIGAFMVVSIISILILGQMYGQVKYDDIDLDYGVRGDTAYFTMESKPGYELYFSGSSVGKDAIFKVLSVKKIGSSQQERMGWETEIGTEDDPCKWTLEFEDKTIVIENGKLVR